MAVLFSVASPADQLLVADQIRVWILGNSTSGTGLLHEFAELPIIQAGEPGTIQVSFQGRGDSKRWKDWMVKLVREITAASDRTTFTGFVDLLADNQGQDGQPGQ